MTLKHQYSNKLFPLTQDGHQVFFWLLFRAQWAVNKRTHITCLLVVYGVDGVKATDLPAKRRNSSKPWWNIIIFLLAFALPWIAFCPYRQLTAGRQQKANSTEIYTLLQYKRIWQQQSIAAYMFVRFIQEKGDKNEKPKLGKISRIIP